MIAHSPGAHSHFTGRRDHGDSYSAAARNLTNRGIGMLHHCLTTRQHYDETKAFPNGDRHAATSSRPRARKASQETEAPSPTHRPQSATSIAPPASKARPKTEARTAWPLVTCDVS
jgi:hypothetical protein